MVLALHYSGTTPDYWRAAEPELIMTALEVLEESRPDDG